MTKRTGCMLAYPFEECRLAKWHPPYINQPKLDGERCRAILSTGKATLLSSTEELITGVPHITDMFEYIAANINFDIEFDGELYCHGKTLEQIHSIVSRKYITTLHPDYLDISFFCFDLVDENASQLERIIMLGKIYKLICDAPHFKLVPNSVAKNYDEVISNHNRYVAEGYEGSITRDSFAPYLRRRSTQMMKFKDKKKDFYKIIELLEAYSESGEPLGMVGSFLCKKGDDTFKVGAGQLTHLQRKQMWENKDVIAGQWCKVGYQNLTAKRKVPRHGLCIHVSVARESEEDE